MKMLFTAIASLMIFAPAFAQAADLTVEHGSSCSAKSVEKYYCPTTSGWWYGPYYDNGCSVKCQAGQKAVCQDASCDPMQSGQAVPSDCHCE